MSTRKFPSGKEIRNLRKSKKLSQTEFAAIASISFRAVSLIETDRQKPSAGSLLLWAEEFKVDFGLEWVKEHLEKKGQPKKQSDAEGVRSIEIVGRIAAGEPIEAIEETEKQWIDVAESELVGINDPRALMVIGDSMKGLNILHGDLVIIGNSSIYQNRIVAVYVVDTVNSSHEIGGVYQITLKLWRRKGNRIELRPANPKYTAKVYSNKSKMQLVVFGVVFKVLRNYDYSKPFIERLGEIEDDMLVVQ